MSQWNENNPLQSECSSLARNLIKMWCSSTIVDRSEHFLEIQGLHTVEKFLLLVILQAFVVLLVWIPQYQHAHESFIRWYWVLNIRWECFDRFCRPSFKEKAIAKAKSTGIKPERVLWQYSVSMGTKLSQQTYEPNFRQFQDLKGPGAV